MYKYLMSLPNKSINNGFEEEYWLGHRMNHCSGRKKNVETRANYILHATKKKSKQEMNYFGTTTMTVFAGFAKDTPSFFNKNFLHLRNVVIVKEKKVLQIV